MYLRLSIFRNYLKTFTELVTHTHSLPPRPERLWGPPSLLSNGYQGLFPCGYGGRGVKLITHIHLVPRSKNEWSCTFSPTTPPWRGAQFKKRSTGTRPVYFEGCSQIRPVLSLEAPMTVSLASTLNISVGEVAASARRTEFVLTVLV
jgi:hypothetical protein